MEIPSSFVMKPPFARLHRLCDRILPMDEVDKELFCHILEIYRTPNFRGIKKIEGNVAVGMVGYDNWLPNSVMMHVWMHSPKVVDRLFIRESFRYPFVEVGVGIAIGATPCNNERALELNRRLGFRRVHIIKDGYALGTDLAIQELRKEDCRWIGVPNGRKEHSSNS